MSKISSWPFDVPPETAVLTSSYVTKEGLPILFVTHECDEDDEVIWQFHCGNGDYDPDVLQLVRLDEILALDQDMIEVARLPLGYSARRSRAESEWVFSADAS